MALKKGKVCNFHSAIKEEIFPEGIIFLEGQLVDPV
jgi:hypothetical protein